MCQVSCVIGAQDAPTLGIKTLSGREVARDELQVPKYFHLSLSFRSLRRCTALLAQQCQLFQPRDSRLPHVIPWCAFQGMVCWLHLAARRSPRPGQSVLICDKCF